MSYFEDFKKQQLINAALIEKCADDDFEKAQRDISKLTQKVVTVNRGGKTFHQTVWVKTGEEDKKQETPIGEELSPTVSGMEVVKYSDKAVLIKGDTYVNINTLRNIKKEISVGSFNKTAGGWIFPIKFLETILGFLWSDQISQGNDEKAQAIQNQKNAGLETGDTANIQGVDGKVEENVSDSEGTKYNIKLKDGTKLEGVDEKVIDKKPETNDKKIADVVNNTTPESRVPSEKKIYGIKPIENIHQYSLPEYMKMHGLSQEDINKVVNLFKKKEPKDDLPKKKTSSGGDSGKKSDPNKIEGLSKRQLISKLIYNHYQAVKKAIESGETVKPEVLATYADLKDIAGKKKQAMSEETKRKISEALKKNKVPENENPDIKKQNEEAEEEGFQQPVDKKNYIPKVEEFDLKFSGGGSKRYSVKNYLDIPAIDIAIPKPKDILKTPKPYFIPDVDMLEFEKNGYQFSAFKVDEDKYLVALGNYYRGAEEKQRYRRGGVVNVKIDENLSYMSLDQLAATESYYRTLAKQTLKAEEDENIAKTKQNMLDRGVYTKEEIAKKRFSRSRIKVMADNRSSYSNFNLYQDISDTQAPGTNLSRTDNWKIHKQLRADIKQKQIDLSLQQEFSDSAYTKGAQTSYGDSGTKDTLLNEYGVKIKRQNGDEIDENETKQIKNTLDSVAQVFGNNKEMNKEFGLKISHSGEMMMHARKAVGIFHPYYNAIGVSARHGSGDFKITFAHEYGHFMDYWIGKKTGNHYASDKQDSTANKIASTLRRDMNKNSASEYLNNTKECLARSMEQYYAVEVLKSKEIFQQPEQVNEEVYETKLKPLIKQFLEENKELLKSNNIFDIF